MDLEFIRGLPADSVCGLSVGRADPGSFAAVAHLAPGLRRLGVYLGNLGDDAASVIASLTALESLALYGDPATDEGRRLDDHALSVIADLPALEYLSLLDGSFTGHGLQQLARLPKLRHLHIEREGLTVPMFRFAATMPALTRLTGLTSSATTVRCPRRMSIRSGQCSRTSSWANRRYRRALGPASQPHQRSLRCAPSWPNSGHTMLMPRSCCWDGAGTTSTRHPRLTIRCWRVGRD